MSTISSRTPLIDATLALLLSLAAAGALAQAAPATGRGQQLQARFAAADTDHDGRLSKDEARAGMPMVYKHFDEIDRTHSGSVSMADIAAYMKARRSARAASAP